MSLPPTSIVRSPTYTLLVLDDGSLRTLREGNKTWNKHTLAPWASLDAFLEAAKPAWWQVKIGYPKGWFNEAQRLHQERIAHQKQYGYANMMDEAARMTEEQRAYQAARSHEKTFGVAHVKFRAEIVAPLVKKYGLVKALDQDAINYTYGTVGSPASKTAAQQLREVEPDPAKWTTFWRGLKDPKQKKFYQQLMYRYLWRSTEARKAEEAEAAAAAPAPAAPAAPTTSPRRKHLEAAIKAKGLEKIVTIDLENERKLTARDAAGEICSEAHSLSFDTVFATIHMNEGWSSNHYMPLNDYLEMYAE
jgi:hypothetical protein